MISEITVFILRIFIVLTLYSFILLIFISIWRSLDRHKSPGLSSQLVLSTVLNGLQIEKTFESEIIFIGRSSDVDFYIDEDTLSSQHARFTYKQNNWFIEDLGSTNGTFLNDVLLDALAVVTNGDIIKCGKVAIEIKINERVKNKEK